MRSLRAMSSAFFPSREAIAAISLCAPSCMPGITLFTPIFAVLSTPHFTFLWPTTSLLDIWPFRSITPLDGRQTRDVQAAFVLLTPPSYNHAHAAVLLRAWAGNSVALLGGT